MKRTYLRLWHSRLTEVQSSLDSLKWLFRILKKDVPNLRQVLTFVINKESDAEKVAGLYPGASALCAMFNIGLEVEEA